MSQSTIVIVDDDQDDYLLLKNAFHDLSLDYKFINIRDGNLLLIFLEKWLNKNHELPDLILMDHHTPRLDGMETLKKLKLDARFYTIPVVINTTILHEKDEKELYNWDICLYNKKKCSLKGISDFALKIHNFLMEGIGHG